MKPPAGYLINTSDGVQGQRGFIYDYILAQNGIFLEAQAPLLKARIRISKVTIRGLEPLEEYLILPYGKIPGYLYQLALAVLYSDRYRERYLAITWDDGYHLRMPEQDCRDDRVVYSVLPSTVVDIHSHAINPAFYSPAWDDADEQGFRLSLVAGRLDRPVPEISLRLVMYGYFRLLSCEEVFACTP
jgi:PRTRC genetic system protein A